MTKFHLSPEACAELRNRRKTLESKIGFARNRIAYLNTETEGHEAELGRLCNLFNDYGLLLNFIEDGAGAQDD